MTRDEFRKCAHELRVALGNNYMEQLEEMVAAYEGVTRWNEDFRAELKEVEEALGKMTDDHQAAYQWGCEWRGWARSLSAGMDRNGKDVCVCPMVGHWVQEPPDEPEWKEEE